MPKGTWALLAPPPRISLTTQIRCLTTQTPPQHKSCRLSTFPAPTLWLLQDLPVRNVGTENTGQKPGCGVVIAQLGSEGQVPSRWQGQAPGAAPGPAPVPHVPL